MDLFFFLGIVFLLDLCIYLFFVGLLEMFGKLGENDFMDDLEELFLIIFLFFCD